MSSLALLGSVCVLNTASVAVAQTGPIRASSSSRSPTAGPVTLSGVLGDSLGNALSGATVSLYPPGSNCYEGDPGAVASGTTAPGGSFSVSASPGSYDVWVTYPGESTDPGFGICTENVDLASSVNDTLTVPVTQLTVTADDSNGDLLQGATIQPPTEIGYLAGFDLFPGQTSGYGYLIDDQTFTTSAAGTAVIPLMPITSALPLVVDPPPGSGLAAADISTGRMTANAAVTATLAGPPFHQSATTLSAAPSRSSYGQPVTFTATVSPTDGEGTVSFSADGNPVADCSGQPLILVDGNYEATCTTSSMTAGSHLIGAAYTGDTKYSASSATITASVTQEPTTTALSSSPASSRYGQAVTFTATVSPADGQGTVSFVSTTGKKRTTLCPHQSLSQAGGVYQANCTTSSLAAGTHTITAAYSGDTNYSGSSATLNRTVKKAFTFTVISSSKNPSGHGQRVSFTVIVSPTDGAGTVTFQLAAHAIPGCVSEPLQATADAYQATCTTASLPSGTGKITAVYSGDQNYSRSVGTLSQVVKRTSTTTRIKSSLNPSTSGKKVTFTGTISATDGSGTMTFSANGKPMRGCANETLTLTSGSYTAACSTTALAIGTTTIRAAYSGDTANKGSCATLKQRVNKP